MNRAYPPPPRARRSHDTSWERTIREIAEIPGRGAPVTLALRDGQMWFPDRAAPKTEKPK